MERKDPARKRKLNRVNLKVPSGTHRRLKAMAKRRKILIEDLAAGLLRAGMDELTEIERLEHTHGS